MDKRLLLNREVKLDSVEQKIVWKRTELRDGPTMAWRLA